MFEFSNFKVYEYINEEDKYFFIIPKNDNYMKVLECLIGAGYDFEFASFNGDYRISVDLFDQESLNKFRKLVEWLDMKFGEEE